MCKNLLEGVLVLLVLLFACGCVFMKKNKYTLRLFLAVIIVLSLVPVRMRREGFSESLSLIDSHNLIDGDTRLQREQKQTNRELDVLEGQIQIDEETLSKRKSERVRQNTPLQLRRDPAFS